MRESDGRRPLDADRIVSAAVAIADREGIESLTIRRLAVELGTKPMTIYHHLSSKEKIVDGMVDQVYSSIHSPSTEGWWRDEIHRRCVSAAAVLADHPWAIPLMESSASPGPANLRHHDAMVACLRHGGFPMTTIIEVYTLLDSYVFGFALQQANLPFGADEELSELAASTMSALEDEYPHITELNRFLVGKPGFSFRDTFEIGLGILLDGLEPVRSAAKAET
jgi:AcrR family transcriptional regulator